MDGVRNISLNIAGKTYSLKAASQEGERLMRLAAEEINRKLSDYDSRYDSVSLQDKLAFVTLAETYSRLVSAGKLSALTKEMEALHGELDSYLAGAEGK